MSRPRHATIVFVAIASALAAITGCASTASTGAPASTTVAPAESAADTTSTTTDHDMAAMPGMDHAAMVTTDATTATADGYTLALDSPSLPSGPSQTLSFAINTAAGKSLVDYQIEQTKKLHLIVVRADLSGFQHLHPTLGADGHWRVPVDVTNPGRWRIITDFTPMADSKAGTRTALGADLAVEGTGTDQALQAPAASVTTDGYAVNINADGLKAATSGTITFTVTKDGAPVTLITPYLGSFGHLVAIRSTDLGYLHVHPTLDATSPDATTGPTIEFDVDVPTPGLHALFLQFATASGVHTASFSLNVGG